MLSACLIKKYPKPYRIKYAWFSFKIPISCILRNSDMSVIEVGGCLKRISLFQNRNRRPPPPPVWSRILRQPPGEGQRRESFRKKMQKYLWNLIAEISFWNPLFQEYIIISPRWVTIWIILSLTEKFHIRSIVSSFWSLSVVEGKRKQ